MSTTTATVSSSSIDMQPSEIIYTDSDAINKEIWKLSLDENFLLSFMTDVFKNHWQGMRFGPIIPGAAYELKVSSAPKSVTYDSGYLTVMYDNGGHFHLCLGEFIGSTDNPTSQADRNHRKPSKAQIFRSYGKDEKPNSWGFEMWNGHNEPMISIFFSNPFLSDQDTLPDVADFSRLKSWREISKQWLGRDPETIDEQGKGFKQ